MRANFEVSGDDAGDGTGVVDQPAALALGALFGRLQSRIPPIDLAEGLEARLEKIRNRQKLDALLEEQRSRRRALVAMLAPWFSVAAILTAAWLNDNLGIARLSHQKQVEERISASLRQENTEYEKSKRSYGVVRGLFDRILLLRDRQPATYQLFIDLNGRWPSDPSWYVSEVRTAGPDVTIKGRTRNEQAVTALTSALENSNGLFTNVTQNSGVPGVTTGGSGSAPQSTIDPATADLREFEVKAVYTPILNPGQGAGWRGNSRPAPAPQAPVPAAGFPAPPTEPSGAAK